MKKPIGILADSSSGITKEDFNEMKNLDFCPLAVIFDGNETFEDDPRKYKSDDDSYNDFISRIMLDQQIAKTAQTSLGKMMEVWEKMLEEYEKIIFIPISKGLSGQYNTACMLAKEPKFVNKVFIFDSNGVSLINWLIINKACALSTKKGITVNEILESLQLISDNFTAFILPRDINYLAKGGRITKSAAALAKTLKLQPILLFDGTIDKFDTTRTFKKALYKVISEFEKLQKAKKKKFLFFLAHAFASEKILQEILDSFESHKLKITKTAFLAKAITAHTGIGTIAIIGISLDQEQI